MLSRYQLLLKLKEDHLARLRGRGEENKEKRDSDLEKGIVSELEHYKERLQTHTRKKSVQPFS